MRDQARDQERLGRRQDDQGRQVRSKPYAAHSGRVRPTLAAGKSLLGELGQRMLQTQIKEFITCARVCGDCLKLRPLRDFGAARSKHCVEPSLVDESRISVCVDEIAKARMAKKQRMRWSPRGARCVATFHATLLSTDDSNLRLIGDALKGIRTRAARNRTLGLSEHDDPAARRIDAGS